MGAIKVTVRHGPRVERERFADLGAAVEAMERHALEIRREGGLGTVKMLREFTPDQRVAARLEVSTGGWLRGHDAGVDVMGDGALVPYAGGIRRRPLEVRPGESAFEAVRRELG